MIPWSKRWREEEEEKKEWRRRGIRRGGERDWWKTGEKVILTLLCAERLGKIREMEWWREWDGVITCATSHRKVYEGETGRVVVGEEPVRNKRRSGLNHLYRNIAANLNLFLPEQRRSLISKKGFAEQCELWLHTVREVKGHLVCRIKSLKKWPHLHRQIKKKK